MEARKLKEKATETFAKGKFAKAAELYQEYCEADPKDLQARLRMGDAWAKAGNKERAIGAYKTAAEAYARDGFLPRAIAASKLIMELDPSHQGVQKMLADLYARRGTPGDARPKRGTGQAAPSAAEPLVTTGRAEPIVPAGNGGPGPFNRRDGIELPPDDGTQLPLDGPLPSAPAAEASLANQPPRSPGPNAIALDDAPAAPANQTAGAGPKVFEIEDDSAAVGLSLDIETPSQAPREPPRRSRPPDADGVDVTVDVAEPEAIEIDVDAEAAPIDHSRELPPELDLDMAADAPAQPAPAVNAVGAVTVPVAPATPANQPPPASGPSDVPPPPAIPTSASASTGAPPGLRPKRAITAELPIDTASPEPEEVVVELTVKKPEPPPAASTAPASRIWLPTGFPGALGASGSEEPVLSPAALAKPGFDARIPPRTDLERGLAALSRFDELDLDMVLPSSAATPVSASASPAQPAANRLSAAAQTAASTSDSGVPSIPALTAPPGSAPARAPATAPGQPPAQARPVAAESIDAQPRSSAPTASAPRAPASEPPRPHPTARPAGVPSFTELELEGDSLLHAVEMAALAGAQIRGEAEAAAHEETLADDAGPDAVQPSGLPKIPLFSDLSPDAFIELFERCPLLRFDKGQQIIEQGSLGDSFFVICGGSVKVVREDNGARRELATLNEGAFFGEMALLSGAPRTASVESDTDDTQLLEISAPVLAQLSHRYPQVAQALKKFCRQRLLVNVMNTSALFQPFNKKDRKSLVEKFRARDVRKGEVLIREGQKSDGLYVLLSGEVEVKKGTTSLAQLKEGEVFGEMSLLNKSPASATVAATKRTSLLRLPREDFDAIILTHPQVLSLVSELNENRARRNAALLKRATAAGGAGEMLV